MNQSSGPVGGSPRRTPVTLAIYRDVRVAMVVLMVMLAVAVVLEKLSATCWQLAISAYYYTSAHSIVIAALLALGTLFIVYRGSSDTENVLLTLAGVSALTAAMVPQGRPEKLCGRADLPPQYNVEGVIQPNVWAVVAALVLGWVVMWVTHRCTHTREPRSPGGTVSLCLFWLIMVVGLIAFIFDTNGFKNYAHGIAGLLLLSAFIATTFCTAYFVGREEDSKHLGFYRCFYRGIAVLMLVTLIAVFTLHLIHRRWEFWTLAIEALLILEFAAYWVAQTIELWNTPDRREHLPDHAQSLLAEGRTKGRLRGLKSDLAEARKEPAGKRLLPIL